MKRFETILKTNSPISINHVLLQAYVQRNLKHLQSILKKHTSIKQTLDLLSCFFVITFLQRTQISMNIAHEDTVDKEYIESIQLSSMLSQYKSQPTYSLLSSSMNSSLLDSSLISVLFLELKLLLETDRFPKIFRFCFFFETCLLFEFWPLIVARCSHSQGRLKEWRKAFMQFV